MFGKLQAPQAIGLGVVASWTSSPRSVPVPPAEPGTRTAHCPSAGLDDAAVRWALRGEVKAVTPATSSPFAAAALRCHT